MRCVAAEMAATFVTNQLDVHLTVEVAKKAFARGKAPELLSTEEL
jgi:hypothetical protein